MNAVISLIVLVVAAPPAKPPTRVSPPSATARPQPRPYGTPELVADLSYPNEWIAWSAALTLATNDPPGIDELVGYLGAPTGKELPAVIQGLNGAGVKAKSAIPALSKYLTHDDRKVRFSAVLALGHIGVEARSTLPEILEILQSKRDNRVEATPIFVYGMQPHFIDPFVIAGDCIARIAENDPAVVEQLIQCIDTGDTDAALWAGRALQAMNPPVKEAAPAILRSMEKMLRESDVITSIGLLGNLGAEVAAPRLNQLANDTQQAERIRGAALEALGGLNPVAPESVNTLMNALAGPNRYAAVEALGKLGPAAKMASAPLRKIAANDKSPFVRHAAALAIWKTDGDPSLAVHSLQKRITAEKPLRTKSSKAGWFRSLTLVGDVKTLGEMGSAAKPALPVLFEITAPADKKWYAGEAEWRVVAAAAIHKINGDRNYAVRSLLHTIGRLKPADGNWYYVGNHRHVLELAIDELADLGTDAESARPVLMEIISAQHPRMNYGINSTRRTARRALQAISGQDDEKPK